MKTGLTLATFICTLFLGTVSFAQNTDEIRKEVRMEEENGVKTLYITTTSKGITTEEVFTGAAADARLLEEMNGRGMEETVRQEVLVTEENGELVVTVITSTQGKIRTEVYTGAEAEAKLIELNGQDNGNGDLHRQQSVQPSIEGDK